MINRQNIGKTELMRIFERSDYGYNVLKTGINPLGQDASNWVIKQGGQPSNTAPHQPLNA